VYTELDHLYKTKFLSLYNADSLNILLKEDIREKILETKDKIIQNIKNEVSGNQPTTLIVAGGMIVGNAIMGQVAKQIKKKTFQAVISRIIGKGAMKLGSKAIPIVGEVLVVYELATLNAIYDEIGNEIKAEFHNNEQLIINNISETLADIDNISSKYQVSVADITLDYIEKSKVPYTFLKDNNELNNKLIDSENYIFLEVLESFFSVPENYYQYVLKKYMDLPEKDKHEFAQMIAKMNDIFMLDNMIIVENELKLKIPVNIYLEAAEFFDMFEGKDDLVRFYSFIPEMSNTVVNVKYLKKMYYPY
jgi:cell division protein ZapA (FtsZ GTPase activity inhibitor)